MCRGHVPLTDAAILLQMMNDGIETGDGTRAARKPRSAGSFGKWIARQIGNWHRRSGYRFMGMDVLFLTTVGRRTGERHETALSWFADGDDAWVIVASAGGAARNPGWYRNLMAHPDQAWIELRGRKLRVTPETLDGARREECWQRIVAAQPRYAGYQKKTARVLPVIRLVPSSVQP